VCCNFVEVEEVSKQSFVVFNSKGEVVIGFGIGKGVGKALVIELGVTVKIALGIGVEVDEGEREMVVFAEAMDEDEGGKNGGSFGAEGGEGAARGSALDSDEMIVGGGGCECPAKRCVRAVGTDNEARGGSEGSKENVSVCQIVDVEKQQLFP